MGARHSRASALLWRRGCDGKLANRWGQWEAGADRMVLSAVAVVITSSTHEGWEAKTIKGCALQLVFGTVRRCDSVYPVVWRVFLHPVSLGLVEPFVPVFARSGAFFRICSYPHPSHRNVRRGGGPSVCLCLACFHSGGVNECARGCVSCELFSSLGSLAGTVAPRPNPGRLRARRPGSAGSGFAGHPR